MTFKIAAQYLTDKEILSRIQKWIQEDKASFLSRAINNIDMPLVDIINAITQLPLHLRAAITIYRRPWKKDCAFR